MATLANRARATTPAPDERASSLRLPGGVFAATTLFVAIGALNSQNNLLFWAFGVAVGAVVVSGVTSGAAMMGVRARRLAHGSARADEPFVVRYRVENVARWAPALALEIDERSSDGSLGVTGFVPAARPGRALVAEAWGTPRRRGRYRLTGPKIASSFPFGFTRKRLRFHAPEIVTVRPASVRLARSVLDLAFGDARHGRPKPRPASAGDELFAVREYSPGDSPRRVAWRASARVGELRVRQFAEPEAENVWLEIDLDGLEPHEVERCLSVAGSLAERAESREHSIGVTIPAWGFRRAPSPGARESGVLLDALATADHGAGEPREWAPAPPGVSHTVRIGGAGGRAGRPAVVIDVRRPETWLAEGASLPASLCAPERSASDARRTWRERVSEAIDRLVGGGAASGPGGGPP